MRNRVLVGLLLGAALTLAPGCAAARRPVPPAQPAGSPAPTVVPPPPRPQAEPGEREMAEAMAALKAGDRGLAAARLETILGMGSRAPSRDEALFVLGMIEGSPDNPARDVTRARTLLRDVMGESPSPSRREAARIVLALLSLEEELEKDATALRGQIDASRSESEDLKATLAQRESELRRIKEILLGKGPGL